MPCKQEAGEKNGGSLGNASNRSRMRKAARREGAENIPCILLDLRGAGNMRTEARIFSVA